MIAPQNAFDAASLNLMEGFTRPGEPSAVTGRVFLLGTDDQGRDMLSAILYGSRVSLLVGFASVVFSIAIGVSLGLIAGYLGGRTDAFIMRIADIQLSFPGDPDRAAGLRHRARADRAAVSRAGGDRRC